MGRVRGMMPSAYSAYMKKMVDGGLEDELPPAADTLKKWRSIYLCYFNSDKSNAQGRRMAKKYCVKNPRPCEISKVLKELGINHILEHDKRHPADFHLAGRIKFKLHNDLGHLCNPEYKSKKQVLRMVG